MGRRRERRRPRHGGTPAIAVRSRSRRRATTSRLVAAARPARRPCRRGRRASLSPAARRGDVGADAADRHGAAAPTHRDVGAAPPRVAPVAPTRTADRPRPGVARRPTVADALRRPPTRRPATPPPPPPTPPTPPPAPPRTTAAGRRRPSGPGGRSGDAPAGGSGAAVDVGPTAGGYLGTDVGCASGTSAAALDAFFRARMGPVIGHDYQHVVASAATAACGCSRTRSSITTGNADPPRPGVVRPQHGDGPDGPCFTLLHRGRRGTGVVRAGNR